MKFRSIDGSVDQGQILGAMRKGKGCRERGCGGGTFRGGDGSVR